MFPTPVRVCSACHPGPTSEDLAGSCPEARLRLEKENSLQSLN